MLSSIKECNILYIFFNFLEDRFRMAFGILDHGDNNDVNIYNLCIFWVR